MTPTVAQRDAALATANKRRVAQAQFRRDLHGMSYRPALRKVAEELLEPCDVVARMKVRYLLGSIPFFGEARATKVLRGLGGVSPEARVGPGTHHKELTTGQRRLLAERLLGRANPPPRRRQQRNRRLVDDPKLLPAKPFSKWLRSLEKEHGRGVAPFIAGLTSPSFYRLTRPDRQRVHIDVVDAATASEGRTSLADLYPELYETETQ